MIRKIVTLSALGLLSSSLCLAQGSQANTDKKAAESKPTDKKEASSDKKAAESKPTDKKKASADTVDPACKVALSATDTIKYGLVKAFDDKGNPDKTYVPIPGDVIKLPKHCLQKTIEFTLHHIGQLQKIAMGHNLVITETANLQKAVDAGMKAGAAKDFVDTSADLVVASTKVIGGGENTLIKLPAGTFKASKDYSFVCTFPGHAGLMTGKIQFVDDPAKS